MSNLKKIYEEALKEKAEILASIDPLRKIEAKLMDKFNIIDAKLRETRENIVELEKPRLAEVSKIIAALSPKNKKIVNTSN